MKTRSFPVQSSMSLCFWFTLDFCSFSLLITPGPERGVFEAALFDMCVVAARAGNAVDTRDLPIPEQFLVDAYAVSVFLVVCGFVPCYQSRIFICVRVCC